MKKFCIILLLTLTTGVYLAEADTFLKVPFCRQAKSYTCGVAAMQSVLFYYDGTLDLRQDVLEKDLRTNHSGTQYRNMIRYAESVGFVADSRPGMTFGDLKKTLDEGKPVICVIQAWANPDVDYDNDWEDGHYVVAMGYDADNVYFMDPSTLGHYTFISISEFLDRWHDRDRKEVLSNFGLILTKGQPTYDPSTVLRLE